MLGWVDRARSEELQSHIDDATSAGAPLGPADAASVLGMALRSQAKRALAQLPLVLAGLPVFVLCFMAYGSIYELHFPQWGFMEETASAGSVATLRQVVGLGWLVLLPLGLFSGWRVARSIGQGRWVLPGLYVLGLLVLISQASLFIERTAWFRDGQIQPRRVDEVSPYSVGLLAISFILPVGYIAFDSLVRRHSFGSATSQRSTQHTTSPIQPEGPRRDYVGVAAILSPLLMWSGSPAAVVFLLLTWVAPSFKLKHRIAATLAVVAPLATAAVIVWLLGSSIDDPGLGFFGCVVFFVGVWAWLATVVLGSGALPTSQARDVASSTA